MSGIFDFIKKLLPRIERSSIEEDLRLADKELGTIANEAYASAVEFFKLNKPTSKQFMNLQSVFYQVFRVARNRASQNFIGDINQSLSNLRDNLNLLQGMIDSSLEKDIYATGMSMRAAFLLRSASHISYLSRYLLSLLNYVYWAEAAAIGKADAALDISRAEMKYVETNFRRFAELLQQYSIEKKRFQSMIAELPEVYVNEKTQAAVMASVRFDDISQSMVAGFSGSPIYAIRMQIAAWQQDRYDSAKEKKTQLELRLLYLKGKVENGNEGDVTVEREISRLQDRIEKLDRKIHETEADILGE